MQIFSLQGDSLVPRPIQTEIEQFIATADAVAVPVLDRLLDLVRFLTAQSHQPDVHGMFLTMPPYELWLGSSGSSITVWIDWYDRCPAPGGVPEFHYRMQISRNGSKLSKDLRADSPEEVERRICATLGLKRFDP